jgi:hypothetical protein
VKILSIGCSLVLLTASVSMSRADQPANQPVRVPFDLLVTKHITVRIKINGKGPYRMIFDTGAPVSILNTRTAKKTGLLSNTGAQGGFNLFGSIDQVKIKKLEIGDLKAEGVPVIVMDHPTIELVSKAFGPIEGIIGFPFFARYRMTLDYQSKEMTFEPNGYEPRDIIQALTTLLIQTDKPMAKVLAPAGVWGLRVDKEAKDEEPGIHISAVLPESPAAKAGLCVGDRLLSLDDRWTDSVADCYSAAEHVKSGTPSSVRVLRDGKQIEMVITPAAGF